MHFRSRFYPILAVLSALLMVPSVASAQSVSDQLRALTAEHANRTVMTYSKGHGTQIEYLDNSGRAFLWYPRNQGVVSGEYKLDTMTLPLDKSPNSQIVTIAVICFKYSGNTYNPVTRTAGGDWSCVPRSIHLNQIEEVRQGDIFGLARRSAVPYVLDTGRATFDALLSRCPDC